MIDVRQAASAAQNYLAGLASDLNVSSDTVRLEEVERSEDGSYWLITLSYVEKGTGSFGLAILNRTYKQFRVDGEGEVRWMHIRQLDRAA